MQRQITRFAAVAAIAAGMAFAQTPPSTPQPATGKAPVRDAVRNRLRQALNLTDAQKGQAKTIFQQARQTAQPLRQQLIENRQALSAAVKANDAAEIQQLSTTEGNLRGQVLAIRSGAMAKFYNILTPDQRATADQFQQRIQQRLQQRFNRRNG
jgi:periplasmic protein CpxP/Spy